jgi:hypothetical protein
VTHLRRRLSLWLFEFADKVLDAITRLAWLVAPSEDK